MLCEIVLVSYIDVLDGQKLCVYTKCAGIPKTKGVTDDVPINNIEGVVGNISTLFTRIVQITFQKKLIDV